MGVKEFFLEPVDPKKETVQVEEIQKKPEYLEEVNLINDMIGVYRHVEANEILVTRNLFGNAAAKVKVKGAGKRLKAPFVKQGYIVNMTKYTVGIKDPQSSDGRYRQDIGLGDDIIITLKVTFSASDNPIYTAKLIKNEDGYINAIRNTSEQIMRILIRQNYQATENVNIDNYRNIDKSKLFDLNSILNGENTETDTNDIALLASNLLSDYGIVIERIYFTDIDLSDRMKDIIAKNIEQENQRKIDLLKAKNDADIAKQEAAAIKSKRDVEIEMLKKMKDELNLTDEQMAKYVNWKALPSNSIAVLGNSNMSDYMVANMVNQRNTNNINETNEQAKTK